MAAPGVDPPQAPPGTPAPDLRAAKRRAFLRGWIAFDAALVALVLGAWRSGEAFWLGVAVAAGLAAYALVQAVGWRRAATGQVDPPPKAVGSNALLGGGGC